MRLLLDLDNTLVDRDGAFAHWAGGFLEEIGGDDEDLQWLLELDAHGYTDRSVLVDALLTRFHLAHSRQELVRSLVKGQLPYIRCYDGVREMLEERRAAGDELVIVTNGGVEQQSDKLRISGLEGCADRVVISQAVGSAKPAPEIFATALEGRRPGLRSWMIGDHAVNDIQGGHQAGCRTGWVTHGATWPGGAAPTVSATTTVDVLAQVVVTEGRD